MSAIKKLLKSDTPEAESGSNDGGSGGLMGRIRGQGSHFPGKEESSTEPTGSTAPGVERESAGPTDTTAAAAPVDQARNTAGPEAGGASHVGTTVAADDRQPLGGKDTAATASSTTQPPITSAATTQPTHTEPSAVSSSTHAESGSQSIPSTGPASTSAAGAGGVAAIGQTTTYSSARLSKGDPTGSVVDRESANPITYIQPEKGSTGSTSQTMGDSGVTSDAALAAASTAFASNKGERMPGEFPTAGYENPYKASHLDPRVDGGKADTSSTTAAAAASTQPSSGARDAALGAGATAGAGASAIGATQAYSSHQKAADNSHEAAGPAPSTLTTTTDPTDRSAEYNKGVSSKGLDDAGNTSTRDSTAEEEKPGMLGKVLGAVGLTGAAGTAAAAIGLSQKDDDKAVETSTSAPESGPPKHYRRESIPTTAYPHGKLDAPRATAPPVGGAQPAATHLNEDEQKKEQSTRSGAGLAAAGVGAGTAAGVAGGAVAAHEDDRTRQVREIAKENTSQAAAQPASTSVGQGPAGVIDQQHKDSHGLREQANAPSATVHDQTTVLPTDSSTTKDDSHLKRDVAVGGAGAAAAGGAAYAAHEHEDRKDTASGTAIPDRTRDTTSKDGPPVAAVAAAPGRFEGQDFKQEKPKEDDHTARNTALGAGAGAAAVGGAAYATHQSDDKRRVEEQAQTPSKKLEKANKSSSTSEEKEKKPGILRRIFKKRKNKDTGEDEDYSTDEEDASSGSQVPHHHSESKGRNVLGSGRTYEEASGGSQKPSYNPFHHDKPLTTEAATGDGKPRDSVTGLPYDPVKDPEAAQRLSHDPAAAEVGQYNRGTDGAPSGGSLPEPEPIPDDQKPRDSLTGLPYDPCKDPGAAKRLSHDPGADYTHGRGTDSAPPGGSEVMEDDGRRSSTASKIKDKMFGKPSADHGDQNTRHGL